MFTAGIEALMRISQRVSLHRRPKAISPHFKRSRPPQKRAKNTSLLQSAYLKGPLVNKATLEIPKVILLVLYPGLKRRP